MNPFSGILGLLEEIKKCEAADATAAALAMATPRSATNILE